MTVSTGAIGVLGIETTTATTIRRRTATGMTVTAVAIPLMIPTIEAARRIETTRITTIATTVIVNRDPLENLLQLSAEVQQPELRSGLSPEARRVPLSAELSARPAV